MEKFKWIVTALLILSAVAKGTESAQDLFSDINITNVSSLQSLSDEQLESLLAALGATPTISVDALPLNGRAGNYFSLQHPEWPPLPGDTSSSSAWDMGDFYLMDDVDFDYESSSTTDGRMHSMSVPGPPGLGDGDGGTNIFTPEEVTPPNYGTNLWIAQVNISSNRLSGIASNTIADVPYEIEGVTNLTQTDWMSLGLIYGSEVTNWTALSYLPVNLGSNLFIRLRSWYSGDGSGLPDWWELQYFGHAGIDPNANPAGDGWSNIQKFKAGWNPNAFYTPAAPQGLTASLNQSSGTAVITWFAAPGTVASYTIEKLDSYGDTATYDYTVSATNTTFADSLSADSVDAGNGNNYDVSYHIMANYTNGVSSPWSRMVALQAVTLSASIASGPGGNTFLTVSGIPASAAYVRLVFTDLIASLENDDTNFNYTEEVLASSFTNGVCQLPAAWQPPATDSYGPTLYNVYAESVDDNDNPDGADLTATLSAGDTTPIYNWGQTFYDGRVQLKQNLIFQLRAGLATTPFQFTELFGSPGGNTQIAGPTNFAYASYYTFASYLNDSGGTYYGPKLDIFQPFEDNYLYRNFVFNLSDLNEDGLLNAADNIFNVFRDGPVGLSEPPPYQFEPPTGGETTIASLLATNQTRWLLSFLPFGNNYYDQIGLDGSHYPTNQMQTGARNIYGLPFLSTEAAWGNTSSQITKLNPGDSTTLQGYFYTETAQPQFQTVEYDFWNPNTDTPPGTPVFTPALKSDNTLLMPLGGTILVAGYEKMALNNGYSSVYGYLGQYFTNAYSMSNGIATTTPTGLVSPYGSFFATQAGPAALITMPDPDTGTRGTCTVYVVSLQLDKNHDGNMDLSFNGPDVTSQSSPFVFWCNNNYDRWDSDPPFDTEEQDDVLPGQFSNPDLNADPYMPDCNYHNLNGDRVIPDTRDLEDFARLWVCGITPEVISNLPYATATLSWGDIESPNTNNPTIDLFLSSGDIGYLTNEDSATSQIEPVKFVGRISPGQGLELPLYLFGSPYGRNRLIWCGAANGTGQLTLTITDGNSNQLVQASAFIQIKDIKQMYERWTVGDEPGVIDPLSHAVKATDNLPDGASPFLYTEPQSTNTPYILHVHGWNMNSWTKDSFAETAFKRLYWQGYQGRFGELRWPTFTGFTTYDESEFNAWRSAIGLLNKLKNLNTKYSGHVYLMAHSMGNVVAGEALRLAGTNQVVNTYIAMQGAVPAHCFDPNATARTIPTLFDDGTPNRYAIYYSSGAPCYFNAIGGAATFVNFFNTNDYALDVWTTDQNTKPDAGYGYNSIDGFFQGAVTTTLLYFPTNTYQIFSFCDEARCYALGAQANVAGFGQQNLVNVWPPDTSSSDPSHQYSLHIWHSAEFRSDAANRWGFWRAVLGPQGFDLR